MDIKSQTTSKLLMQAQRLTHDLQAVLDELAWREAKPVDPPALATDGRSVFGAGRRGGLARAEALSPKRRREIAQLAAEARWGKK